MRVGEDVAGRIDAGLLVYVGIAREDGEADVEYVAHKIRHLRIFPDADGRMNRDVIEASGAALVISNFSLLGDARKGRRPDYTGAASPERALELFEQVCMRLRTLGVRVETGRFREMMLVTSVNDGPINVLIDSGRAF